MTQAQLVFCRIAMWCLHRAGYRDIVFVPVVDFRPHVPGAVTMQSEAVVPTFIHGPQPTPVGPFGGFLN